MGYFAKFPYRYRYRYRYFPEWPYRYRYRYRYFSNCPYRYRYRYRYFPNFFIDIFIDIDIFQIFLSIYFRYRYSQNRCRYFIDISKKTDIWTIDIDISSKKHEKTLISAEKNGFFTQNVHIDIDIDIFKNVLIDIDIDIDIFKSDLIDIDIDIDIFKKCRYIDNRYGLSIYRTPLVWGHFLKVCSKCICLCHCLCLCLCH